MISPYNRLLPWSKPNAAQTNLEISHSHLRRILDNLRRISVPGGYPILYHRYRSKYYTGAFRSYRRPGLGVHPRLLIREEKPTMSSGLFYRQSVSDARAQPRELLAG